jgi:hypothetical protein
MKTMRRLLVIAGALLLTPAGGVAADTDEVAVKEVLMVTFDKPEARLAVDPVVVAGDYAVAGWIQAKLGGRALLRRRAGQWALILCSGDGIVSTGALQQAGVPRQDAENLSVRLETAENAMPAERRALLSTFEGTVLMGTGGHPGGSQHVKDK